MIFQKVDPLQSQVPIVDPKSGLPTPQLIRQWQQAFQNADVNNGALAGKVDKTTEVIAGTGLSGGGTLAGNVTLDLDANIGDLNDVDVTTNPPTDGQVLAYDQANSIWVPADQSGGGGGGGSSQFLGITSLTLPADFNVATGAWQSPATWTTNFDPLGAKSTNSDVVVPTGATLVRIRATTVWSNGSSNRAIRVSKPDESAVLLLDIRTGVFESASAIVSPLAPVVAGETYRIAYNSFSTAADIAGGSGSVFGKPCRVEFEWYSAYPTAGGVPATPFENFNNLINANSGAFGSRGGLVIPERTCTLQALMWRFQAEAGATGGYDCQVVTLDGSNNVLTIVATVNLPIAGLGTTSVQPYIFTFPSPITLTKGTRYGFLLTRRTIAGNAAWTMNGTNTAGGILVNLGGTVISTYIRATVNVVTVGQAYVSGVNSYWWAAQAQNA